MSQKGRRDGAGSASPVEMPRIVEKADAEAKQDAPRTEHARKGRVTERANRTSPRLDSHIVLFFDLLGFKEMMIKAASAEDGGADLLARFDSGVADVVRSELVPEGDSPLWKYKGFTDNFVVALPADRDAFDAAENQFGLATVVLAELQLRLALGGWFVRGGMAYGSFFMDDVTVFGPPLVEAVTLESKVAKNPRVVMSLDVERIVLRQLKFYSDPYESPQNGYVLRDADGLLFLNYLYSPIGLGAPHEYVVDVVRRHKDEVERQLADAGVGESILAKYRWVARYHNFFCDEWLLGDVAALKIVGHDAHPPPTLLVAHPTNRRVTVMD